MRRRKIWMLAAVLLGVAGLAGCAKKVSVTEQEVSAEAEKVPAEGQEAPGTKEQVTQQEQTDAPKDNGGDAALNMEEQQNEDLPLALTVAVREFYDSAVEDGILLSNKSYQEAFLPEAEAEQMPQLNTAFQLYAKERREEADRLYQDVTEMMRDTYSQMSEAVPSAETPGEMPCGTVKTSVQVRRADSRAVSLLEKESSYAGGAHPSLVYYSAVFDAETGKRLSLTDVVSAVEADGSAIAGSADESEGREAAAFELLEKVKEKLLETYPAETFFDLDGYFADCRKTLGAELTWTLGYDGLTFYFSPYEIGPYAAGTLTAALSFEDAAGLIAPEYLEVPDEYGLSFESWEPLYIDMDDDGKLDEFRIECDSAEFGGYDDFTFVLNGETYEDEEFYCYFYEPYLLHVGEKKYLYLEGTLENDYRVLKVYEVTGDGVALVDSIWSAGVYNYGNGESEEEWYWNRELPLNPKHFRLSSRMDTLSTAMAVRDYCVGANGLPEAKQEAYVYCSEIVLTAKVPLAAVLVPEEMDMAAAESPEQVEIPAGEELILYRTDNSSYVDVKRADGSICRLEVDLSRGWPQKVNGMDAEECFDGMMFAG